MSGTWVPSCRGECSVPWSSGTLPAGCWSPSTVLMEVSQLCRDRAEQRSLSAAPRAYPSGAGLCGTTSARAQPLLYETVTLGDKTPSFSYQGRARLLGQLWSPSCLSWCPGPRQGAHGPLCGHFPLRLEQSVDSIWPRSTPIRVSATAAGPQPSIVSLRNSLVASPLCLVLLSTPQALVVVESVAAVGRWHSLFLGSLW